jgi:hypothetical protein
VWSSWAHLADYGLCLTRTNWSVPKHRGLTWFGVPVDAEGVTLRVIRLINGGADFCEEFFDDVVVPDAERIGDVDHGWTVARTMLVFERGARAGEVPTTPIEPGPLAPDLVGIARQFGRDRDPVARQLIARAHVMDYLRAALDRRIAITLKHAGADAGIAAYGKLRQLRHRAGEAGDGTGPGRIDRVGRHRGHRRIDRARVPQREDQLDRRWY